MFIKHKEVCLSINGAQSVRLKNGATEFKNYFKQIPVPFKIYADCESNLKSVESYEGFYAKTHVIKIILRSHIKIMFLIVLLTNLFVLMMNLLNE